MRTLAFLAISLLSGAAGGLFLGLVNQVVAEPFIDQAIGIETQRDEASGNHIDPATLLQYRTWQKAGEVEAATILGTSLGALFGIVFAYTRKSLPGQSHLSKALFLAGIMWTVLFLTTALKYPPNPPAVGNPDTLYYRQTLYLGFISISGISALVLAIIYRALRVRQKSTKLIILMSTTYIAIIGVAVVFLPPNPDAITAPMQLVTNFRIVSVLTMASYWGVMSVVFGTLWDRLAPQEARRVKLV